MNQQKSTWIRPGERIEVNGHSLLKGNFYVGDKFLIEKKYINQYPEAANKYIYGPVINPELNVSTQPAKKDVFHSYNDLSPYLRNQYLLWLSGELEVKDLDGDILLLHLLGLKLRMFFDDKATMTEREEILREACSLKDYFGKENQKNLYNLYLDFIDNAITKYFSSRPQEFLPDEEIKKLKAYRTIILENIISKESVLSAQTVYDLGRNWIYSHSPTPPQYEHLAQEIFKKAYRRPIEIQMHSHPQIQSYSLNDSLTGLLYIPESLEAYVPITSTPFNRWEVEKEIYWAYRNVYRAFSGYNRAIRENAGRITLEAIFQMPKPIDIFQEEKVKSLMKFLEEKTSEEQFSSFSTNELLRLWEVPITQVSLPKRVVDSVLTAFDKLGYGIEPDYRVHNVRFKQNDSCVIFRKTRKSPIKIDQDYRQYQAVIKMALLMAQTDGEVRKDEIDFVSEYIKNRNLDITKQKYLQAHLTYQSESKQKYLGLKSYPQLFDPFEVDGLYNFLIRLAIIDGEINDKETAALKKIMDYFDRDCTDLHSVIHRIYTEGTETPFMVIKEEAKNKYMIPPPRDYLPAFKMDDSKLAVIEKDTVLSQQMLSEIFGKEEKESVSVSLTKEDKTIDFIRKITEKEIWNRTELESICKGYNITVGAMLEAANDYSYGKINDSILDDDGENVYVTIEYKEALL